MIVASHNFMDVCICIGVVFITIDCTSISRIKPHVSVMWK